MIYHAYETVPFYQGLINNIVFDIKKLPIIEKKQMIESGRSLLSSKYMGKYLSNQLKWTRTSGSSGLLYEIYWDKVDDKKSMLELWLLRWKYYKVSPKQKMCYFFPADIGNDDYVESDTKLAISRKCLYDGNLSEIYKKIKQYKPEWMILQPGISLVLCELAKKYGIWKEIRYIEFTGEFLREEVRKCVEDTFCCITANQYGTKEVNSIAYECPEGNMHVMTRNVYLENKGQNLYVTSLSNYAMPFIRYKLDDRGCIRRGVKCKCGRCGDVIDLYEGRENDVIKLPKGEKVHSYTLMQSIHRLNYKYEGCILQYRIVQEAYDKFTYYIVLNKEDCTEDLKREIVEEICCDLHNRIGNECICNIIYENNIYPESKTGKCKVFLSNVQ